MALSLLFLCCYPPTTPAFCCQQAPVLIVPEDCTASDSLMLALDLGRFQMHTTVLRNKQPNRSQSNTNLSELGSPRPGDPAMRGAVPDTIETPPPRMSQGSLEELQVLANKPGVPTGSKADFYDEFQLYLSDVKVVLTRATVTRWVVPRVRARACVCVHEYMLATCVVWLI